MELIKQFECPDCGALLTLVKNKEPFFCKCCGCKVTADENCTHIQKLTRITANIEETPIATCSNCSRVIFLLKEKKFLCQKCEKYFCRDCYHLKVHLCKECLMKNEETENKGQIPDRIAGYALIGIIVLCFFYKIISWIIEIF